MSRRALLVLAAAALFLLAACVVSPLVGTSTLDLRAALDPSIPAEDNTDRIILFELRLARTAFAALVGMALAAAGAVFQSVLRNELATPYTLGISGGASFGALLAFLLGWGSVLAAGVGLATGLATAGAVLLLARYFRGPGGTVSILLAGVTLNLLFSSLILVLQYLADPYQTYAMLRWLMGGLDVVGLGRAAGLAPVVAVLFVGLLAQAPAMNLLALDDLSARGLGIDPDRRRFIAIGLACLLTAVVVSFSGPIGFVGLLVPHAVRRLGGWDMRLVLPASLLAGGGFLVWCDVIARLIGGANELPTGIVTALLGGPFFLYVLLRREAAPAG